MNTKLLEQTQGRCTYMVVLGTRDCTALAGRLSEADVRPMLEDMLSETPAHVQRVEDRESGLALIRAGD
jgi:uncharacterized protein